MKHLMFTCLLFRNLVQKNSCCTLTFRHSQTLQSSAISCCQPIHKSYLSVVKKLVLINYCTSVYLCWTHHLPFHAPMTSNETDNLVGTCLTKKKLQRIFIRVVDGTTTLCSIIRRGILRRYHTKLTFHYAWLCTHNSWRDWANFFKRSLFQTKSTLYSWVNQRLDRRWPTEG